MGQSRTQSRSPTELDHLLTRQKKRCGLSCRSVLLIVFSHPLVQAHLVGDAVLHAGLQKLCQPPLRTFVQIREEGIRRGSAVDLGDVGPVTHRKHLAVDAAAADDEDPLVIPTKLQGLPGRMGDLKATDYPAFIIYSFFLRFFFMWTIFKAFIQFVITLLL